MPFTMNLSTRARGPIRLAATIGVAFVAASVERAAAQEPVDSLRAELARLGALVDSLQQQVA